MTEKEKNTLVEALSYAGLNCLPQYWGETRDVWAQAIVLVTKANMTKNYAIAVNDGLGNPVVIQDFGDCSKIVRIDGIYPYCILDDSYKPNLKNKAEITAYLKSNGFPEEEVKKLLSNKKQNGEEKSEEEKSRDKEVIKKYVIMSAVNTQLEDIRLRSLNKNNTRYE